MRRTLISVILVGLAALTAACARETPNANATPSNVPNAAVTTSPSPTVSVKKATLDAPDTIAGLSPISDKDADPTAALLKAGLEKAFPAKTDTVAGAYRNATTTASFAAITAPAVTEQQIKTVTAQLVASGIITSDIVFTKQGNASMGCAKGTGAITACGWFDSDTAGAVVFNGPVTDANAEIAKVYAAVVKR